MKNITYRSQTDNFSRTSVENIFINKFMPMADGDYVKVYLYGLKNSQFPDQFPMSNAELARFLNIDEETIRMAYEYWSSKGIVEIRGSGDDITILFLDISQKFEEKTNLKTNPNVFPARYKNDERYKSLISKAENMLGGQVLPFNFIQVINTWLEEYHFDYECVCYLMEYCLTSMDLTEYHTINGKMNYLNKVAQNWYSNHICCVQDAIFYTKEFKANNKLLHTIFNELGIHRSAMRFERELVNKWINEYKFSKDIIMEGVKHTKAPNLSYLDKILTNWQIHNVRNVEEARMIANSHRPKKKKNKYARELPVSDESIQAAKSIEYGVFETILNKRNFSDANK